jgi:hypothetical protein
MNFASDPQTLPLPSGRLRLPTLSQRVLAVYVLGFQFFQAIAGLLAPVALGLALFHA